VLDLDIFFIFEQFLASGDIVFIVVNAQNPGVWREVVDNGGEGSASGSADIQNILDLLLVFVAFSNRSIGDSE
jgi:hypothetical protein